MLGQQMWSRCSQVVTGVGKHSQGGQPRILPAIVRVLMASGLSFRSQPGNAGVIEVHLPGQPLRDGLRAGLSPLMLCLQTPVAVPPPSSVTLLNTLRTLVFSGRSALYEAFRDAVQLLPISAACLPDLADCLRVTLQAAASLQQIAA